MKRGGIARAEDLLTEALLNPELARTLLMKASAGNRPLTTQRLASQLGTLAAASGAETEENRQQQQSQALAGLPVPNPGGPLAKADKIGVPAMGVNKSAENAAMAQPPQTLAQIMARTRAPTVPRAAPLQFNPLAAILARGSNASASP